MLHDASCNRGQIPPGWLLFHERPFTTHLIAPGAGPGEHDVRIGLVFRFAAVWRWVEGLEVEVQGALGTGTGALHDVEVDHGGGDVGMAEASLKRGICGC